MPWFVIIPSDSDLMHHGVKGQKWGVRRYQNKDGSLTALGKSRSNDKPGSVLIVPQTLVAMAALSAADMASRKAIQHGLDMKNPKVDPKSLPKKTELGSKDEDMKVINSGHRNGGNRNCVNCSVAYDLRRRGYDVKASYRVEGRGDFAKLYKGARINIAVIETDKKKYYDPSKKEHSAIDKLYDAVDQHMDNNSRGILTMHSPYLGIRHAVSWEKNNGEFTIRDCQTGKITDRKELEKYRYKDFAVIRTDNLEPNWDNIGSAIRYKKSK